MYQQPCSLHENRHNEHTGVGRPVPPYDNRVLEARWRPYWRQVDLYRTGDDPAQPYVAIFDFFPYPSGEGLSVGHCRNYIPTCVATRFRRMRGDNVLHPMGWDAFGLPAENYAILHGVHPAASTARQVANYRRQMELIECCYDWSREINSTDPDYYRWTQWFFLLLFRRGLAYRAPGRQWWCPTDQTILANEQVEDGRCWRCGSQVTKKELPQWYFRITDYAERLLADLELVDWPDSIKAIQRHWIGRSEGFDFQFAVSPTAAGPVEMITVFTTRPDTLYGVTFIALAPEHRLALALPTAERRAAVAAYVAAAERQSERERQAIDQPRSGVFTGAYARHPATGAAIPIWVADYVLLDYGHGAIMGVPAHDSRDHAFALAHDLPVVVVVQPDEGAADDRLPYTEPGTMVNSGPYSGFSSAVGGERLYENLRRAGVAERRVTYRFRDWLISRQRYWGAPIPIVHCPACGAVPVPDDQLPVHLPHSDDFAPTGDGRSPLARLDDWVNTTCPTCGGPAQRETDTMDGFACSSWYFLRYASPHEAERPFDPSEVRKWLPVDIYVGGAEHAVMHLLYARFWTKVMADAGLIDFVEPFVQLRNQGTLHAADGRRMSKSKGNVVTPDDIVARHGVDALRTYILFIGPFDADVTWDEGGIKGVTRFLERTWRLAHSVVAAPPGDPAPSAAFERARHALIKKVTADFATFKFNTAIAALMGYLNDLGAIPSASPAQWRAAVTTFTLLLAPIAPFIAEEIWQNVLGHPSSVHRQPWPEWDEAALVAEEIELAVQVNGRLRDTVTVATDADETAIRAAALSAPNVQRHTAGQPIHRVIVVPGKLINVVTG